jgi:hypothetical protein
VGGPDAKAVQISPEADLRAPSPQPGRPGATPTLAGSSRTRASRASLLRRGTGGHIGDYGASPDVQGEAGQGACAECP